MACEMLVIQCVSVCVCVCVCVSAAGVSVRAGRVSLFRRVPPNC